MVKIIIQKFQKDGQGFDTNLFDDLITFVIIAIILAGSF